MSGNGSKKGKRSWSKEDERNPKRKEKSRPDVQADDQMRVVVETPPKDLQQTAAETGMGLRSGRSLSVGESVSESVETSAHSVSEDTTGGVSKGTSSQEYLDSRSQESINSDQRGERSESSVLQEVPESGVLRDVTTQGSQSSQDVSQMTTSAASEGTTSSVTGSEVTLGSVSMKAPIPLPRASQSNLGYASRSNSLLRASYEPVDPSVCVLKDDHILNSKTRTESGNREPPKKQWAKQVKSSSSLAAPISPVPLSKTKKRLAQGNPGYYPFEGPVAPNAEPLYWSGGNQGMLEPTSPRKVTKYLGMLDTPEEEVLVGEFCRLRQMAGSSRQEAPNVPVQAPRSLSVQPPVQPLVLPLVQPQAQPQQQQMPLQAPLNEVAPEEYRLDTEPFPIRGPTTLAERGAQPMIVPQVARQLLGALTANGHEPQQSRFPLRERGLNRADFALRRHMPGLGQRLLPYCDETTRRMEATVTYHKIVGDPPLFAERGPRKSIPELPPYAERIVARTEMLMHEKVWLASNEPVSVVTMDTPLLLLNNSLYHTEAFVKHREEVQGFNNENAAEINQKAFLTEINRALQFHNPAPPEHEVVMGGAKPNEVLAGVVPNLVNIRSPPDIEALAQASCGPTDIRSKLNANVPPRAFDHGFKGPPGRQAFGGQLNDVIPMPWSAHQREMMGISGRMMGPGAINADMLIQQLQLLRQWSMTHATNGCVGQRLRLFKSDAAMNLMAMRQWYEGSGVEGSLVMSDAHTRMRKRFNRCPGTVLLEHRITSSVKAEEALTLLHAVQRQFGNVTVTPVTCKLTIPDCKVIGEETAQKTHEWLQLVVTTWVQEYGYVPAILSEMATRPDTTIEQLTAELKDLEFITALAFASPQGDAYWFTPASLKMKNNAGLPLVITSALFRLLDCWHLPEVTCWTWNKTQFEREMMRSFGIGPFNQVTSINEYCRQLYLNESDPDAVLTEAEQAKVDDNAEPEQVIMSMLGIDMVEAVSELRPVLPPDQAQFHESTELDRYIHHSMMCNEGEQTGAMPMCSTKYLLAESRQLDTTAAMQLHKEQAFVIRGTHILQATMGLLDSVLIMGLVCGRSSTRANETRVAAYSRELFRRELDMAGVRVDNGSVYPPLSETNFVWFQHTWNCGSGGEVLTNVTPSRWAVATAAPERPVSLMCAESGLTRDEALQKAQRTILVQNIALMHHQALALVKRIVALTYAHPTMAWTTDLLNALIIHSSGQVLRRMVRDSILLETALLSKEAPLPLHTTTYLYLQQQFVWYARSQLMATTLDPPAALVNRKMAEKEPPKYMGVNPTGQMLHQTSNLLRGPLMALEAPEDVARSYKFFGLPQCDMQGPPLIYMFRDGHAKMMMVTRDSTEQCHNLMTFYKTSMPWAERGIRRNWRTAYGEIVLPGCRVPPIMPATANLFIRPDARTDLLDVTETRNVYFQESIKRAVNKLDPDQLNMGQQMLYQVSISWFEEMEHKKSHWLKVAEKFWRQAKDERQQLKDQLRCLVYSHRPLVEVDKVYESIQGFAQLAVYKDWKESWPGYTDEPWPRVQRTKEVPLRYRAEWHEGHSQRQHDPKYAPEIHEGPPGPWYHLLDVLLQAGPGPDGVDAMPKTQHKDISLLMKAYKLARHKAIVYQVGLRHSLYGQGRTHKVIESIISAVTPPPADMIWNDCRIGGTDWGWQAFEQNAHPNDDRDTNLRLNAWTDLVFHLNDNWIMPNETIISFESRSMSRVPLPPTRAEQVARVQVGGRYTQVYQETLTHMVERQFQVTATRANEQRVDASMVGIDDGHLQALKTNLDKIRRELDTDQPKLTAHMWRTLARTVTSEYGLQACWVAGLLDECVEQAYILLLRFPYIAFGRLDGYRGPEPNQVYTTRDLTDEHMFYHAVCDQQSPGNQQLADILRELGQTLEGAEPRWWATPLENRPLYEVHMYQEQTRYFNLHDHSLYVNPTLRWRIEYDFGDEGSYPYGRPVNYRLRLENDALNPVRPWSGDRVDLITPNQYEVCTWAACPSHMHTAEFDQLKSPARIHLEATAQLCHRCTFQLTRWDVTIQKYVCMNNCADPTDEEYGWPQWDEGEFGLMRPGNIPQSANTVSAPGPQLQIAAASGPRVDTPGQRDTGLAETEQTALAAVQMAMNAIVAAEKTLSEVRSRQSSSSGSASVVSEFLKAIEQPGAVGRVAPQLHGANTYHALGQNRDLDREREGQNRSVMSHNTTDTGSGRSNWPTGSLLPQETAFQGFAASSMQESKPLRARFRQRRNSNRRNNVQNPWAGAGQVLHERPATAGVFGNTFHAGATAPRPQTAPAASGPMYTGQTAATFGSSSSGGNFAQYQGRRQVQNPQQAEMSHGAEFVPRPVVQHQVDGGFLRGAIPQLPPQWPKQVVERPPAGQQGGQNMGGQPTNVANVLSPVPLPAGYDPYAGPAMQGAGQYAPQPETQGLQHPGMGAYYLPTQVMPVTSFGASMAAPGPSYRSGQSQPMQQTEPRFAQTMGQAMRQDLGGVQRNPRDTSKQRPAKQKFGYGPALSVEERRARNVLEMQAQENEFVPLERVQPYVIETARPELDKILMVGDSQLRTARPQRVVESLMEGSVFVNYMPGATTSQVRTMLASNFPKRGRVPYEPGLIILAAGTNDLLGNESEERLVHRLKLLIQDAKQYTRGQVAFLPLPAVLPRHQPITEQAIKEARNKATRITTQLRSLARVPTILGWDVPATIDGVHYAPDALYHMLSTLEYDTSSRIFRDEVVRDHWLDEIAAQRVQRQQGAIPTRDLSPISTRRRQEYGKSLTRNRQGLTKSRAGHDSDEDIGGPDGAADDDPETLGPLEPRANVPQGMVQYSHGPGSANSGRSGSDRQQNPTSRSFDLSRHGQEGRGQGAQQQGRDPPGAGAYGGTANNNRGRGQGKPTWRH